MAEAGTGEANGRQGQPSMSDEDIEASRAPLITHLIELRQRLIWSLLGLAVAMTACFFVAGDIFNLLLIPYERASGEASDLKLIFTAPQEFFFTKLKIALFGGICIAFPVIATQLYRFVAPGLYRNERSAFLPYIIATPVLFILGGSVVYFIIMPLAKQFFIGMQQAPGEGRVAIELLPRVSEYLGLIMTLILAFGFCFQLPVVLTLMARVGLTSSQGLKEKRKYAVVGVFAVAAFLTPPDLISQVGLAIPTLLLYEVAIFSVRMVEKKDAEARAAREAESG